MSVGEETLALHLNAYKIPFEREVKLIPGRKFRTDFVIRDYGLAIEVEGGIWQIGRHQRPKGFERDCEKLNAIQLLGWVVLRFTTGMVEDGTAINTVLNAIKCSKIKGSGVEAPDES